MSTSLIHDQLPDEWELPDQKDYRRKQIAQWIFDKKVDSFDEMLNISEALRNELKTKFFLKPLTLVRKQGSRDTTRKFLFQTRDQDFIECVLIPASPSFYGERSDRFTLCISSQVGCAYGCKFCASGLDGWKRNLSPGEIISQIIEVEKLTNDSISNLVFMGMGEPFANFKNLTTALMQTYLINSDSLSRYMAPQTKSAARSCRLTKNIPFQNSSMHVGILIQRKSRRSPSNTF